MSATWLRDWCIFYKAKTVFADVSNRNKLHATCDINIRRFCRQISCIKKLPRWVLSFLKHVSGSSFDFFIFVNLTIIVII